MTHVYSIFDVLFLVWMKQCVRWNTIAVKPSEKAVNSRVCESKLHGKSICLFLWGLMSCWFSSRQNDYSCTVYQKWESWPCLVTFHCSWNDAHNRDLWRYQVWYVFLRISFYYSSCFHSLRSRCINAQSDLFTFLMNCTANSIVWWNSNFKTRSKNCSAIWENNLARLYFDQYLHQSYHSNQSVNYLSNLIGFRRGVNSASTWPS